MRKDIVLLFLLISGNIFCQNDENLLLSKGVYQIAENLEKKYPSDFLDQANHLYFKKQLNDAGFLFNLGILRYRYFLLTNSTATKDDFELYNDLKKEYSLINFDLSSNAENLENILNEVIKWDESHDYVFFSKTRNPDNHLKALKELNLNKEIVSKNKELIEILRDEMIFVCAEELTDREMKNTLKRKFKALNPDETEIVNRLSEYIVDEYRNPDIYNVSYNIREGLPLTIDIFGFNEKETINNFLCKLEFDHPFKIPKTVIFLFHNFKNTLKDEIKYAVKYSNHSANR